MARVVLKNKDPAYKKKYVNAGRLSCAFEGGVSEPMDKDKADLFVKHFGESFVIQELKGKAAQAAEAAEAPADKE